MFVFKKINFMNISKKHILLIPAILAVLLLIAYPFRGKIKRKISALIGYSSHGFGGSGNCPSCHVLFTDNVKTHEKALENEVIKPQNDFKGLEKLLNSGKLTRIITNRFYIVRNAKYSRPYVLPQVQIFLDKLANEYKIQCKNEKLKYIPFTITSVTRSLESVNELEENNSNAIKNSAHLKGKTLDISYRAFNKNRKQTKAFIKVLKELKLDNNCFVKFERNGCLHITVI